MPMLFRELGFMATDWTAWAGLLFLTVVAIRMGRRGVWIIAPWSVAVAAAFVWAAMFAGVYDEPASSMLMRRVTANVAYTFVFGLPFFGLLVALCIKGVAGQRQVSAETFA